MNKAVKIALPILGTAAAAAAATAFMIAPAKPGAPIGPALPVVIKTLIFSR